MEDQMIYLIYFLYNGKTTLVNLIIIRTGLHHSLRQVYIM